MLPDPDSHSDVFALGGYLLAAAPGIDLAVSTDSVRRPPAEVMQAVLTLANMTDGEVAVQVGGGEAKQCQPFGHKRSQGMSRMEDLFQIFNALLDSGGAPIDFEGRRWTFEQASIGGGMRNRPKLMGLGGGPMLIDHTTSYADGLATTCPPVYAGPDEFADAREQILKQVEAEGPRPRGVQVRGVVPVPDRAATAPSWNGTSTTRSSSGSAPSSGASRRPTGRRVGLESPFPEDWRYYNDLLPQATPDEFIDDVLAKVTRDHVLAGWVCGTPAEVAATVRQYVDAGADWVCPMDYLPIVGRPRRGARRVRPLARDGPAHQVRLKGSSRPG